MRRDKPILLAEDDENDAILIQHAFADAGVDQPVYVVQTRQTAIQYLKGEGAYAERQQYPFPALLVLAWQMKGIGASEVLRWLDGHPRVSRRLPVIILSSAGPAPEMEAALGFGADSFLVKPVRYEELVALAVEVKKRWLEVNRLRGRVSARIEHFRLMMGDTG
jgi:CheY-like chemotaxis protein